MSGAYLLLSGETVGTGRQLQWPLKVMPGGYFGDATGYRQMVFNSDFPLLNRWHYDEAEARRGVLATKRAKFHGSRILHLIARDADAPPTTNPHDYWYQREVGKENTRATLVPALRFMRDNGLLAILSAGHEYNGSHDEYAWWDEWTGMVRQADLVNAIGVVEILGNEVGVNRGWLTNDTPAAMAYAKPIQDIVRRNLPGVLISNGDFGNEEDVPHSDGNPEDPNASFDPKQPTLCSSSVGAELIDSHPRRSHDGTGVRYPHTIWNATHYFGTCRKPLNLGEEPGENHPYPENRAGWPRNLGGDVYVGNDNPHYLHTRLAIGVVTGSLVVYLNGPGVRRFVPLDSTTYFHKIMDSLAPIPDDIPTWRDGNNPSWWMRGKEFVYVGLEAWGQVYRPPRPVATWAAYDIHGLVKYGVGPKPLPAAAADVPEDQQLPAGWLGGILKGEFV